MLCNEALNFRHDHSGQSHVAKLERSARILLFSAPSGAFNNMREMLSTWLWYLTRPDIRVADFFVNRLRNVQLPTVPQWDPSHYGYLTWATVKSFCTQNHLAATLDVFAYNVGQIFREEED